LEKGREVSDLLHDPGSAGEGSRCERRAPARGRGLIEAPRGTLFHHYKVDENDLVTMLQPDCLTTNNNVPMNRAVEKVAKDYLSGKTITEGPVEPRSKSQSGPMTLSLLRNQRAGTMPLVVELFDSEGTLPGSKGKVKRAPCCDRVTGIRGGWTMAGPALAETVARMQRPGLRWDCDYQLTVRMQNARHGTTW